MKFLFDIFPLVLFFGAYKVYVIYAATATAIIASIAEGSIFRLCQMHANSEWDPAILLPEKKYKFYSEYMTCSAILYKFLRCKIM